MTSPDVFSYSHSTGLSGKKPSSVTIAARIARLSSFYRPLIRMSLITGNPCDKLERAQVHANATQGAGGGGHTEAAVGDTRHVGGATRPGYNLTLSLTGRRRNEVLGLRAGDLQPASGAVVC